MWKKLALLPLTLTLFFLSGCKLGTPFRGPAFEKSSSAAAVSDQTVVVGLTHIVVGKDRNKAKAFWQQVMKVNAAMEVQPGYLGGAIRRQLLGKQGWTMSVWQDQASLDAFVDSALHQEAMRIGMPGLARSRFARVQIPLSEMPLSWARAEEILRKYGWEYDERVMRRQNGRSTSQGKHMILQPQGAVNQNQ